MGMYTRAYDAHGKEWQFKTGDDQLNQYPLGKPACSGPDDRKSPPCKPDGVEDEVYDGIGAGLGTDSVWAFVVIKGGICVEIEPEEMIFGTIESRQKQLNGLCDKWLLPRQKYYGFGKGLFGEPPPKEVTKKRWMLGLRRHRGRH